MYVRKQFMKQILVQGTQGFHSTSFLFHIIGYIVFKFKQINLGFDQNPFKCPYKLFCNLLFDREIHNT